MVSNSSFYYYDFFQKWVGGLCPFDFERLKMAVKMLNLTGNVSAKIAVLNLFELLGAFFRIHFRK